MKFGRKRQEPKPATEPKTDVSAAAETAVDDNQYIEGYYGDEKAMAAKKKKINQAKLNNTEVATFCSQMAMVVKSGIPTVEGIHIMMGDAGKLGSHGRAILEVIEDALDGGLAFSDALEETTVFPDYVTEMIRLGESAGKLDEVLDSLTVYYSREEAIAKGVKAAVTYPMIMIGMMMIIVLVLMVKVMPMFNEVFSMLGAEMTGFSLAILNAGNIISRYAVVFVVLLAVILAIVLYLAKTENGRKKFSEFASKFVLTRGINLKIALGRFANGLSMTLTSGLDPTQCLELVDALTEHPVVKEKIKEVQADMEKGVPFSEALINTQLFGGVSNSILAIGDKSGAMDAAMNDIAIQYSNEVDESIERMLSILEPTLVAIISVIVGLILLSVMFPLIGIMSNIG